MRTLDGQYRFRVQGMDSLPAPDRQDVQLRRQDGGFYAAIMFNGKADPVQVDAKVCCRMSRLAVPATACIEHEHGIMPELRLWIMGSRQLRDVDSHSAA
jgi:hypothetical protein